MKKAILVLFIISIICIKKEEKIIIPNESIRFRIIANSNSIQDQTKKMEVLSKIYPTISSTMSNNISVTRENIEKVNKNIKDLLKNLNVDYEINYGENYFPQKKFLGTTYEADNYESLVITLGEAKGDNWWCVLFPPLCLLEAQQGENPTPEYKLYVKEILKKK